MLAWLFERKIFSPTISDPSIFFMKKKKKNNKKNKTKKKQTNKKKTNKPTKTKNKKKKKKKQQQLFFCLKMDFEGCSRRKIGDAKFYIHRQHKI